MTLEYSNTENKHGQWTVIWSGLELLFQTGYFGVAPAHLPSVMSYGGYSSQCSFKLNSNGYIQQEMVYNEGYSTTYTYHYDNDKASASKSSSIKSQKHKAPVRFLRKKKEVTR
jgi:hypothetical protein